MNRTYVLLLNPDAVLQTDLEPLREACDLPGCRGRGRPIARSGRAVRRSDSWFGNCHSGATLVLEALLLNRVWPSNPVNRRYRGLGFDYNKRFEVEQPAGAFLMVRRAVWQELGGFDEGFHPLWFEDVDFCRRLSNRGYRLYYEPEAVAKHTGGHSISSIAVEMRQIYWYRSLTEVFSQALSATRIPGGVSGCCGGLRFARRLRNRSCERSFKPIAVIRESRAARGPVFLVRLRGDAVIRGPTIRHGCKSSVLRFLFMAHNDFVSVTIVTYNSGRFIKRCLESVLAQKYPLKEIIVVDNASTDGTVDILEQFEDRCRIVYNDENIGFAAAQNQAIALSNGEWVLTLNPDVLLLPNFIQALVDAGQFDPKIGTVCGKLLTMTAQLRDSRRSRVVDSTGIYFNSDAAASRPRQPGSG